MTKRCKICGEIHDPHNYGDTKINRYVFKCGAILDDNGSDTMMCPVCQGTGVYGRDKCIECDGKKIVEIK